ncbi:MAG: hypothetical protein ABIR96_12510 [Bdellovibrionota bacterium]
MKNFFLLSLGGLLGLSACNNSQKTEQKAMLDAYCTEVTRVDIELEDPGLRAAKMAEYLNAHITDSQIKKIFEAGAMVDPSARAGIIRQGVQTDLGIKDWDCPGL